MTEQNTPTTNTFDYTSKIDHGFVTTVLNAKSVPSDPNTVHLTIGRESTHAGNMQFNSQEFFFSKDDFVELTAFFTEVEGML